MDFKWQSVFIVKTENVSWVLNILFAYMGNMHESLSIFMVQILTKVNILITQEQICISKILLSHLDYMLHAFEDYLESEYYKHMCCVNKSQV